MKPSFCLFFVVVVAGGSSSSSSSIVSAVAAAGSATTRRTASEASSERISHLRSERIAEHEHQVQAAAAEKQQPRERAHHTAAADPAGLFGGVLDSTGDLLDSAGDAGNSVSDGTTDIVEDSSSSTGGGGTNTEEYSNDKNAAADEKCGVDKRGDHNFSWRGLCEMTQHELNTFTADEIRARRNRHDHKCGTDDNDGDEWGECCDKQSNVYSLTEDDGTTYEYFYQLECMRKHKDSSRKRCREIKVCV